MIYKFKSWIQLDKSVKCLFPFIQKLNLLVEYIPLMNDDDIEYLSCNRQAVPYLTLKENQSKICWECFLRNEEAIEYIKKYQHIVNFNWEEALEILNNCSPEAIEIIDKYLYDEIYDDFPMVWNWLSSNTGAVELLKKKYYYYIDWSQLSKNPEAIHLLKRNIDKIDWSNLSGNKNAIDILLQHPSKIDWRAFSRNTNSIAIKMLEENPDKIDWGNLTRNPAAIHLLEANPDKVSWSIILLNPNIYDYDYAKMKMNMDVLREEMMIKVWKPSRVMKWIAAGCDEILE
jgi:hypothetical protein